MGKPYQSEIADLPTTISWALSTDITALSAFVSDAYGAPLIATGSGGSPLLQSRLYSTMAVSSA